MKIELKDIRQMQEDVKGLDKTGFFHGWSPEIFLPIADWFIDWTLRGVKTHFEEEERLGARGYSANRPAKIIENLRSNKVTLRDIYNRSLNNLREAIEERGGTVDGKLQEDLTLLEGLVKNFPVSDLVTHGNT